MWFFVLKPGAPGGYFFRGGEGGPTKWVRFSGQEGFFSCMAGALPASAARRHERRALRRNMDPRGFRGAAHLSRVVHPNPGAPCIHRGERDMSRPILTAEDVADELQVSLTKAYEIMHEIPHLVSGRTIRITRKAWEAYLRRIEVQGWERGSTSAATSGGAPSTGRRSGAFGSRRGARTAEPPKSQLLDSKGRPRITVSR